MTSMASNFITEVSMWRDEELKEALLDLRQTSCDMQHGIIDNIANLIGVVRSERDEAVCELSAIERSLVGTGFEDIPEENYVSIDERIREMGEASALANDNVSRMRNALYEIMELGKSQPASERERRMQLIAERALI